MPGKGARTHNPPSGNGNGDTVWTVPQLASYLQCHPSTVYRLLGRGELPAFRLGSDWRFLKSNIDRWVAKAGAHAFD